MITRHLAPKLKEVAAKNPVITLTGPRQSGKTTLLKHTFPHYDYVSLEEPDERAYALKDPRGFLSRFFNQVIIDEAQRVPHLFSYIQTIVDTDDMPGRFILSGSQNFLLLHGISQSLAGRSSILHLLPFCKRELTNHPILTTQRLFNNKTLSSNQDLFNIMTTGFYPRIHDKHLNPHEWLADYFQTYIQRDVRDLINVGDTESFIRFVKLCAGRAGQLLNLSSLGADCGISHTTAARWLSLLESSFIIFRLMPHHQNFSKRLIKSPKLYFFDCGLLCYLLRIKDPEDLRISPYRGAIFENFCIAEFIKSAYNQKLEPNLFFWRDSSGHEIDMLIEQANFLLPFEIKSSETFNESFINNLTYWINLAKNQNKQAAILYGGSKRMNYKGIDVIPWLML
ncbi:MAG: ATP-binding protein [Deltaproteobacteria bacterium]|nr:ATP-binding protein [Deltaproteobacteria bacterium]